MKKLLMSVGFPILVMLVLFGSLGAPEAQAGTFTVTLSKGTQQINTPGIVSGTGPWIFSIAVSPKGKVNSVGLNIKNNSGAGDICWNSGTRQPKGSFVVNSSPIPAADFNVCGDQWVDPDLGLNLQTLIQTGDASATVTITVQYPDP